MTWKRLFQTTNPHRWAAVLGRAAEVATTGNRWWLRIDADADWASATGPVGWIDAAGRRAARPGGVATGRLETDWRPLEEVLRLHLPPAAVIGPVELKQRTPLRLVRDPNPPPVDLKVAGMIVALGALNEWIDLQPTTAFTSIQWAVDAGQALLIGPVPPIAGVLLIDRQGVLVQAGWTPTPPVSGRRIRSLTGAGQGDVVVWTVNDGLQVVAAGVTEPLRRGAVRLAAGGQRCLI